MEKEEYLRELIKLHSRRIIRTAFFYVKDKMTAEDITQEVFIRAFHKMEECRSASSVESWLYRITVNLCKDYVKSWSYRKLHFTNKLDFMLEHEDVPDKLVDEKYQSKALLRNVMALPLKYREVVMMYYFEDLKTKEIAELTGDKESTVRVRLSRALKKLRFDITEEENILWNL